MSILTKLATYAKFAAVVLVRLYVLILGLWGVYGLVTGTWLAAAGLVAPALYVGWIMVNGYRQAGKKPPKQQVAN